MKPYWVSWYAKANVHFLLSSPWWVNSAASRASGKQVCVAAIMAVNARDAADRLFKAHDYDDEEPFSIRLRYVREMPYGWTPFGRKRDQASWMIWPSKPH